VKETTEVKPPKAKAPGKPKEQKPPKATMTPAATSPPKSTTPEAKKDTKVKQHDLRGGAIDVEDVETSSETRIIVSFQTAHIRVRTTKESIDKAKGMDIADRDKWLKEKMKVTDGEISYENMAKEIQKINRKIFA